MTPLLFAPEQGLSVEVLGSYLRDVCYGTLLHAPCVDPVFEPGKTQKADGLTKILGRNLQLAFMSELGMKVPSYM